MSQAFKFYTPIKVRFIETDQQGHVYFGSYYTYFDVALEEYLTEIGYAYPQMLQDGADFVYAESHCAYKSPAKWPEIMHAYVRVGHIGNRSLRFDFEIKAKSNDRLIATGHIVAVTANRETFTPQPVPDRLRQAITAFEDER